MITVTPFKNCIYGRTDHSSCLDGVEVVKMRVMCVCVWGGRADGRHCDTDTKEAISCITFPNCDTW